jgi:DNA polymerase-3 subunit epsilon
MKKHQHLLIGLTVVGLGLAAFLLVTLGLLASTLEPAQQRVLGDWLAQRWLVFAFVWLMALALSAWGLGVLVHRFIRAPMRLLENGRVLLHMTDRPVLLEDQSPELRELAQLLQSLAGQREALRQDLVQQVAQASVALQQEKNQLAALLHELSQSVVVCKRDGRIVLYNQRARLQLKALFTANGVNHAAFLGIGRSIYGWFEPQLIAHALSHIEQCVARGVVHPVSRFVSATKAGQLLRVQMAPVHSNAAQTDGDGWLSGYVLLFDNATPSADEEAQRQLLRAMNDNGLALLNQLQQVPALLHASAADAVWRARAVQAFEQEVAALTVQSQSLAQRSAQALKMHWPLEDMLGFDLLVAVQKRIGLHCQRDVALVPSPTQLWLRVDSFSMVQALLYLAERLVDELDVRFFQLRLQADRCHAQLDLIWSDRFVSTETVMTWQMDPMCIGSETLDLSVRDVVARHGGELLFGRERPRYQSYLRFTLPLAQVPNPALMEAGPLITSRPEFYDFDLFRVDEQNASWDDRPLHSLSYTVFDTETTGLNPTQGDEIIQIGAVRIVNGKLLRQECFDQLVNPGRTIPTASIQIHGITPDMVQGQPTIAEVLPAFHAFARDTVLVAHNAAFDMRFLQQQEVNSGLVFTHPVLDTLLLSAVLHPNQSSHRLEAIAQRLNIRVYARHTALGDAMVTADVFLRFLDLLQMQGINTLAQARRASQKTYYAKLKY